MAHDGDEAGNRYSKQIHLVKEEKLGYSLIEQKTEEQCR